jgi:hypothetical protein
MYVYLQVFLSLFPPVCFLQTVAFQGAEAQQSLP